MTRDTLLAYTYFNEGFRIRTNARKFQLTEVTGKNGKPIALYSRKLTDAQKRYTATEKELLGVVKNIKEFRTILLGQRLIIYTDRGSYLMSMVHI